MDEKKITFPLEFVTKREKLLHRKLKQEAAKKGISLQTLIKIKISS